MNKSKNIFDLIPAKQVMHTNGQPVVFSKTSGSLNNKHIVYQPNALKGMCERLQHDQ